LCLERRGVAGLQFEVASLKNKVIMIMVIIGKVQGAALTVLLSLYLLFVSTFLANLHIICKEQHIQVRSIPVTSHNHESCIAHAQPWNVALALAFALAIG
jgi:hypothetical protein